MPPVLASVGSLLFSVAILLTGNGLQSTLISVRANLEDFSTLTIGLLQSGYFAGFVAGCIVCPHIVRRVGHIRAFAVMASSASVSALMHVLLIHTFTWWLLRVSTGFCLAGLFMVAESWLNERAVNQNRGRILSVYFMVNMGSIALGQLFLMLADPKEFILFVAVSILISLALVPVTLTTAMAPAPIQNARLHFRRLFNVAPLGVAGCLAVGLANGAFWGLAPVFIQDAGLPISTISFFISLVIVGGIISQWPLGKLSDQYDRRRVMTAMSFLAVLSGLALAASGVLLPGALLYLAFTHGAIIMPLYAISIAHVNDFADPKDFLETSGGLLFFFGMGAILGPLLASLVMEYFGYWTLFLFTATVHAILGLYGIYRISRRAPVPIGEQSEYVPVPRSSPVAFGLHPDVDKESSDS